MFSALTGLAAAREGSTIQPTATVASPTAANNVHLRAAQHWLKAKRPDFAVAHLRRVDLGALWEGADLAMARMVLMASSVASDRPALAAVVDGCNHPGIADFTDCWEARAIWHFRRGDVTEALAVWDAILRRFADARPEILGRTLQRIVQAYSFVLAHDPGVQDGALTTFLRRWYLTPSMVSKPRNMLIAARTVAELDWEAPVASAIAEEVVVLLGADPKALALRGAIASRSGQPGLALPWNLWAAYTANSVRRDDAPYHWRGLASLYETLGWPAHAADAFDRAGSDRPTSGDTSAPPEASDEEQPWADCREWHDGLIGYHPESLALEHGIAWSTLVEDARAWQGRCGGHEVKPQCLDRRRGWPGLPRKTAAYLRRAPESGLFANYLRCAIESTTVIADEVRALVLEPPPPRPRSEQGGSQQTLGRSRLSGISYARGLALARIGQLDEALAAWDVSFARPLQSWGDGMRLVSIARTLATIPRPVLRTEAGSVRRHLEEWWALGREAPNASDVLLGLAKVALRLDPEADVTAAMADEAILVSEGAAVALGHRGQVAVARDRPARALPWLHWAQHAADASRVSNLSSDLQVTYTEVGWWARADPTMSRLAPTDVPWNASIPGPVLPEPCGKILDDMMRQNVRLLIARHGERWLEKVPQWTSWVEQCESVFHQATTANAAVASPAGNR